MLCSLLETVNTTFVYSPAEIQRYARPSICSFLKFVAGKNLSYLPKGKWLDNSEQVRSIVGYSPNTDISVVWIASATRAYNRKK